MSHIYGPSCGTRDPERSRDVQADALSPRDGRVTFVRWVSRSLQCMLVCALGATGATAQESEIGQAISVELNGAETQEAGCLLSFLVINGFQTPVARFQSEIAVFATDGAVDQVTLFDFGSLPPARPRVRQFVLSGATCDQFGRILFNGVRACDGHQPVTCEDGLILSTRTSIEVSG